MTRLAFVPPAPLLLPEYVGIADPAPDLRRACEEVVSWLVEDDPARVVVIGDPADEANVRRGVDASIATRVATTLLASAGYAGELVSCTPDAVASRLDDGPCLVLANGSARRHEKGPGHLDERSFGFDETVVKALASGSGAALSGLDVGLGDELLTAGLAGLHAVGAALTDSFHATVSYVDDPFGVAYWVVAWTPVEDRATLIPSDRSVIPVTAGEGP